jgi:hypothetical protein
MVPVHSLSKEELEALVRVLLGGRIRPSTRTHRTYIKLWQKGYFVAYQEPTVGGKTAFSFGLRTDRIGDIREAAGLKVR